MSQNTSMSNLSIYKNAIDSADFISGLDRVFSSIKRLLGDTVFLLLGIILFPLIFLIAKIVLASIISIAKKERNKLQITTESYSAYMNIYLLLKSRKDDLHSITSRDLQESPWILRGIGRDIIKIDDILAEYKSELEAALGETPTKEGKLFQHVNPEELWEKRAKVYSYKI